MNAITLGSFDLFHYGHTKLLKRCRELSDELVTVGLNTDEFIMNYKNKSPLMSYEERYKSIEETDLVDQIIPNTQLLPGDDCKDIILDTESNLIVIGSDWARKPYLEQLGLDWDWMDKHGISLAYVPYTWEISSTQIKERIWESA